MTCDERRVIAFVRGELSEPDEHAFDQHLLSCDACWRAVQEDRLGRLALQSLQVSAPPDLADRVALAVGLATEPSRGRDHRPFHGLLVRRDRAEAPRRTRRLLAAGALVVLVLAAVGGVLAWTTSDRTGADPPQIARVAAMMSPGVSGDAALRHGERFDFGGQHLTVRSYRVDGGVVLVATSPSPFPMPARVHLLPGSSPEAWMESRDELALYGVDRPAGRASMFLVAAMPMAELPQVAARLHLI